MGQARHLAAATALIAAAALTLGACSSDSDSGGDTGTGTGGGKAKETAPGTPGSSTAPAAGTGGIPAPATSGGSYYVALGDSYAAGVMIPETVPGSPKNCSRSSSNYAHLTAKQLAVPSFTDVTCGAATTADLGAPQVFKNGGDSPAAQFDALGPQTKLVTLGIGGNDIGFGEIMTTCVMRSGDKASPTPCKDAFTKDGKDVLAQRIKDTAAKVDASLKTIRAKSPDARVLLVGYPSILPETGDGCPAQVPIAVGDLDYLRGVIRGLNTMLSTSAGTANATYVDTFTPGLGHDVCQPAGTKWVEGIAPQSPAAPAHPNALGQQGMAAAVLAKAKG
ncbi:SGNH/GDSL hydrolase family protein [Yinghuangia soli]|uniref:SGNH/GDSL hydrolase family protein n=1 Tax=Yinghuangia soli TaxID=2908204 RepID=A0AA41QA76_9ACTN|nr:SGNH/GDSL hydrolase family protein [Yinghuangia soli]MCF2533052.1 SGNH/GDSL hydrolase family protein [Yinghuangia soli]